MREEAAQFLSRQWQSMPPPLVAFRQCIIQSPVPSELVPSHQLVNREVQRDIAKDLPARGWGSSGSACRTKPAASAVREDISLTAGA